MSLLIIIPCATAAAIIIIRKFVEWRWGWVKNGKSLDGKTYIITGANTGLGFETTKALMKRNAKVIMGCRNLEKANEAISKIRRFTTAGEVIALEIDLTSFDSIKKFAKMVQDEHSTFDCLINNAGLAVQDQKFTKEQFELHFGVNHLGHFLLTDLLKEQIKQNSARVVVVSSKMHEKGQIDFENLGKYVKNVGRTNSLYNNSKLMNFYFAKELYKKGVNVHVLCPGLCNTDFFRDYNPKFYHYIMFAPVVWLFLRSSEQGAQNIIHCATDNINTAEENPSKSFLVVNVKQTKSKIDLSDEVSERLWNESVKMCAI